MSLGQVQLVDASLSVCGIPLNPLFIENAAKTAETIQSICGKDAAAGNLVLVPGVAGKHIKVFALSCFAPAGTAIVTATFTDGAGGSALFIMPTQAPNQATFSFGIAVSAPTFLFATSPGNDLVMNLDSAAAAVSANLSYWIE